MKWEKINSCKQILDVKSGQLISLLVVWRGHSTLVQIKRFFIWMCFHFSPKKNSTPETIKLISVLSLWGKNSDLNGTELCSGCGPVTTQGCFSSVCTLTTMSPPYRAPAPPTCPYSIRSPQSFPHPGKCIFWEKLKLNTCYYGHDKQGKRTYSRTPTKWNTEKQILWKSSRGCYTMLTCLDSFYYTRVAHSFS